MLIFKIQNKNDIALARGAVRDLAEKIGFTLVDKTRIATAASEIARNTLVHGGGGTVEIDSIQDGATLGIRCVFKDQGPGIADIDQVLNDDQGAPNGSGQGLPATKHLMDILKIESQPGISTRVEIIKWISSR
jgi:serine/threonine-protein kinase RsbT